MNIHRKIIAYGYFLLLSLVAQQLHAQRIFSCRDFLKNKLSILVRHSSLPCFYNQNSGIRQTRFRSFLYYVAGNYITNFHGSV